MSHAHIALLDSAIRSHWHGMGPFGLSKALNTSAKQTKGIKRKGRVAQASLRDSSTPRNDTPSQREWWHGRCNTLIVD